MPNIAASINDKVIVVNVLDDIFLLDYQLLNGSEMNENI